MSKITGVLVMIMLLWISIHTLSYAAWNWKHENKFGSIAVILVSLASIALPIYMIFFKALLD